MLVLTRQTSEEVIIGDDIRVRVVSIRGDKVVLGFSAPKEVPIHREEVYRRIHSFAEIGDRMASDDVPTEFHHGAEPVPCS